MEEYWRKQPLVTKYFVATTLLITLSCQFGILSPYTMILDWHKVVYDYEVWRVFTNFFVHRLGFSFLIHLFFIIKYMGHLEETHFAGRLSDFVYFLLLSSFFLLLSTAYFNFYILGTGILFAI